ncbi:39S ribosomal protein L34, mitochondrial [Hylaeus volcanicus]|uniref:39S ribosomal protein L34, mitochondrial n=1 Tax=Hylaeus volcanicus TaxID=313075 RepID=UPI0023B84825|nr:39S ribosomal protein L34, mitochondrial [Hylaeus volcanicus]
MFGRLISNACQVLPRLSSSGNRISSSIDCSPAIVNQWSFTLNRTKVRNNFPRPSELIRVKRHGWFARMATLSGRKILMRRILKGRHVLSH